MRVWKPEKCIIQCYNLFLMGPGTVLGKREVDVTYSYAYSFVPTTMQVLHGPNEGAVK